MSKYSDTLLHSWNAFMNRDPPKVLNNGYDGVSSSFKPDRTLYKRGNERTIVQAVINRMAIDCAAMTIEHIRTDDQGRYLEVVDSGLNYCLNTEANIDQTARAFRQDVFESLLDEGYIAVVPTETTTSPLLTSSFSVDTMRTGKILEWYPASIKTRVYNDKKGVKEDIFMPKKACAIVQNPFFSVMNESNSTLQRIIRKLNALDLVDKQSSAGKLDLIVQLPFSVKSENRRKQAELRKRDLEDQLTNSKYGVAYTDATEKIVQLNRPMENNLLKQIEYLTPMLFSQLGITEAILNGTAKEEERTAYLTGTIEPIVSAFVEEINRKFLSKTARTQHQTIIFYRDPFKTIPADKIADLGDKLTRNEIMSSNEIRQKIGLKPVQDQRADELRNKNINVTEGQSFPVTDGEEIQNEPEDGITEEQYLQKVREADEIDSDIDELENLLHGDFLAHYASPYYDPVKAHEYYEAHKKLKGRLSTSGLNDKGKETAEYVKKNLYDERDSKINTHRAETDSKIQSEKDAYDAKLKATKSGMDSYAEQHKNSMDSKITLLKNKLKSMSKEDRARYRDEINSRISQLRNENRAYKSQLNDIYKRYRANESETFKTNKQQLNDTHKTTRSNLKEEYTEKYASELDKIKSDKSMLAEKKSTTKTSTTKKTSTKTDKKAESLAALKKKHGYV